MRRPAMGSSSIGTTSEYLAGGRNLSSGRRISIAPLYATSIPEISTAARRDFVAQQAVWNGALEMCWVVGRRRPVSSSGEVVNRDLSTGSIGTPSDLLESGRRTVSNIAVFVFQRLYQCVDGPRVSNFPEGKRCRAPHQEVFICESFC